jgi:glycosyltransferase involved in cell wall biosynthesis
MFGQGLAKLANQLNLDLLEAPEFLGLTAFLSLVKPPRLRVVVRLHTCSSIVRHLNKTKAASLKEHLQWKLRDRLEKRSILTADAVTAVSSAIVEETRRALRLTRSDFQVVPNSVNDSAFSPAEGIKETDSPMVLFIGRLEWRKGPDLLIRALPNVLMRQPRLRLCLVGMDTLTAPARTSMLSYLRSLLPNSALPNVSFRGHLSAPEVAQAMQEATVCVFPSRYEGLPMVCLEAMARGKPIITTDIPGFRELISDGETGLIARGEDPESLTSTLERLLADAPLRAKLGAAAQEFARARFRGAVVANSMVSVYRAALVT